MATPKKTVHKTAPKKVPPKTPKAAPSDSDICFTIMPFGGWFDDYYASIYMPAIEAAGMTPKRADDLYRPSTIVHDIWEYTQKCKVVLADLTGKNPNVFYELGLAHALAKPAILIAESMEDVPFDLRALRVIEYDKNKPDWGASLHSDIKAAILEVKDSPLEAVLPAFLSVKVGSKKKEVTESELEILELRRDMDMLRNELLRTRRVRAHEIDPEEAITLIQTYVERDMPTSLIVRRLRERGAPEEWVEKRIVEARTKRQELTRRPS